MGTPFSQPCGVFHGRTEALSGSKVEQPPVLIRINPSARSRSHWAARNFISGSRVRGADLVTFKNFSEFPAGDEVGDQPCFLDGAVADLGDELAVAAHEHFAVLQHALLFA